MASFANTLGVARYERMMLMWTTRFKLLGGIGIAIPVLIGGFLAILEVRGVQFPSVSGGAYMAFYVYSYLQAVVIAFLVGDFRADDVKSGASEVLESRPIGTLELVAGKYLGVVGALFTLSLSVLILTLAIQAAKISITDQPF